jgi:hypothetical protein
MVILGTSKMKKAKIVITHVDHQTNRIAIRGGKNGRGKEIWGCQYWPDFAKSVEQMDLMLNLKIASLIDCDFIIFDEFGEVIKA